MRVESSPDAGAAAQAAPVVRGPSSRLAALGWFDRVRAEQREAAQRAFDAEPVPAVMGRAYHADAEELAEGGIRDFVGSVRDVLRDEGVSVAITPRDHAEPESVPSDEHPRVVPLASLRLSLRRNAAPVDVIQRYGEDGYSIALGTRRVVIWSRDEVDQSWILASVRTVALLNELLDAHGSRLRAWAIGGGNEESIVFATPEQAAVINTFMPPNERLSDGHEPLTE